MAALVPSEERVDEPEARSTHRYFKLIPPDFPNYERDRDTSIVDTLIVMLLQERVALSDPTWRPAARARIEAARAALVPFGNAPYSTKVRYEMLVDALDRSEVLTAPIELRAGFVQVVLGEAMPDATLDPEVVRDAVALWPEKKARHARTRAVRALAKALGCDHLSLLTMLRAARMEMRDRRVAARRK
jgi:hypothetical protein